MGVASCPKRQPVLLCNLHQRLLGLCKSGPHFPWWWTLLPTFSFFSDTHCVEEKKQKWLENWTLVSFLFTRKTIFISFNERKSGFYTFYILLAGKSRSLLYRQTANRSVPAWPDFNFWMCSHILTSLDVRKKHSERAWNQHNKCVLLRVLCGGLIM